MTWRSCRYSRVSRRGAASRSRMARARRCREKAVFVGWATAVVGVARLEFAFSACGKPSSTAATRSETLARPVAPRLDAELPRQVGPVVDVLGEQREHGSPVASLVLVPVLADQQPRVAEVQHAQALRLCRVPGDPVGVDDADDYVVRSPGLSGHYLNPETQSRIDRLWRLLTDSR